VKKKVTVKLFCFLISKDYRFEALFVPLVDELDGSGGNCLRVDGIVRCLERKD